MAKSASLCRCCLAETLALSPLFQWPSGRLGWSGSNHIWRSHARNKCVKYPQLLPGLVRFLNRHPALSYLFAHDFVGGSGQSVRPDERGSDALDDLVLALALLERQQDIVPELLWKSLASFLCDGVGNSHRAEINIEKLWNPYLPGRGRQGWWNFDLCACSTRRNGPRRSPACFAPCWPCLLSRAPTPCHSSTGDVSCMIRFALPFYLKLIWIPFSPS